MTLDVTNLETAEKIAFDHGQINVAVLDGTQLARAVFNPGWRWSIDAGARQGRTSCPARHVGIVLAGRFHVRMDDGTEADLGPGDAHVVPPGHDAWVVGDEQCVIVDIGPAPVAGPAPEAVVRQYFAAFNAAAVDDILALFTEDATVAAEGMPSATGTAALRSVYERFLGAMAVTETETVESVVAGADLAVVRTSSTGTATVRATGETTPLRLRELFALRATAGGWRICEYAFNDDADGA